MDVTVLTVVNAPKSPKMSPAIATKTIAPRNVQITPKIRICVAVLRFLSFSTI